MPYVRPRPPTAPHHSRSRQVAAHGTWHMAGHTGGKANTSSRDGESQRHMPVRWSRTHGSAFSWAYAWSNYVHFLLQANRAHHGLLRHLSFLLLFVSRHPMMSWHPPSQRSCLPVCAARPCDRPSGLPTASASITRRVISLESASSRSTGWASKTFSRAS